MQSPQARQAQTLQSTRGKMLRQQHGARDLLKEHPDFRAGVCTSQPPNRFGDWRDVCVGGGDATLLPFVLRCLPSDAQRKITSRIETRPIFSHSAFGGSIEEYEADIC